jgi:hypothetical protein
MHIKQRSNKSADRRGDYDDNNRDVNQAQLNEASEIFGTDYL